MTLGVGAVGLSHDPSAADVAGKASPASNETEKPENTAKPRIRGHRTLGRTGLRISDISIGTGAIGDPAILREAVVRGINYIDTADGYPIGKPGRAERLIAPVLKGRRHALIVTSKTMAGVKHNRKQLMARLHKSLRRLGTNYIDIYLNHGVNELARIQNDEWFEFSSLAKKQGKIRFSGMSGHGGHLIECLDHALGSEGLVDVILTAYNFGQDPAFYERLTKSFDLVALQPDLPRVLAKAHAMGVGTLAMKTLRGARLNDMRPYEKTGGTFAQAALRWVLSNPDVDGLVITIKEREQLDEYLVASGSKQLADADLGLLERYAAMNGASYCQHGCNQCESSCPESIEISELLRTRMYATDYGDLEQARGAYRELSRGVESCLVCEVKSCMGACPSGIDIPSRTRSLLTLLELD